MRRIIALAASAAAAATVLVAPGAFAAPSSVGDCGAGDSKIPHSVIAVPAGGKTFYIDDRGGLFTGNGTWVYEETNLKTGLQRKLGNGSNAPVVGKTLTDNGSKETCNDLQGGLTADSMLF